MNDLYIYNLLKLLSFQMCFGNKKKKLVTTNPPSGIGNEQTVVNVVQSTTTVPVGQSTLPVVAPQSGKTLPMTSQLGRSKILDKNL